MRNLFLALFLCFAAVPVVAQIAPVGGSKVNGTYHHFTWTAPITPTPNPNYTTAPTPNFVFADNIPGLKAGDLIIWADTITNAPGGSWGPVVRYDQFSPIILVDGQFLFGGIGLSSATATQTYNFLVFRPGPKTAGGL